jgi:hypothetical protein
LGVDVAYAEDIGLADGQNRKNKMLVQVLVDKFLYKFTEF